MDSDVLLTAIRTNGLVFPHLEMPDFGEPFEIADGVYWIRLPLLGPLKWINVWLIKDGDGFALVDTGINSPECFEAWQKIKTEFLKDCKITKVIITHMHPDHVGLAGYICQEYNVKMYMSRLEYVTCKMLVGDTGRPAPEAGVDFYRAAGWDEVSLANYRQRFGGFGQMVYHLPDIFERLSDGQIIKIGDEDWRIITGTGHSPEHCCLYNSSLNMIISGDQILPKISSNISVFPTEPNANPMADWINSCTKLLNTLPESVFVLPSHNAPFYGVRYRLNELIEHHERALLRLKEFIFEKEARAVDCFSILFKKPISGSNFYMATGEALSHLNYLLFENYIKVENRDGVNYYSAINQV